ncbi:MAG TPA: C45 family autoproteolytic acyltransferase/hydrolase [Stellaceae bacterium]|nr:C45 family autoproteolytic acyltransferase/hydrolase [Stellaceae bacterium]
MLKRFVFAREDRPDAAWLARFAAGREEAERWYLGEGLADPPTAAECRAALGQHMPELVPHYDRVCALVGDDDLAHRVLSHYRPPPLLFGCTQAIWLGEGGPALVRNYDFPLDVVSDRFELTAWFGRRVIAKAQPPWGGCLDGMNEDGLVASITFGGNPSQGLGFSIILMLRYVLETCCRVDEAIAALSRIPVALSQNVTLLDRSSAYATVFLGPGRAPAVSMVRACANHQEAAISPEWAAASRTVERQRIVLRALDDPAMTLLDLTARFLDPPLYSRRAKSTTAYTAVYRPAEGRVDYLWPGKTWCQRFDQFEIGDYTHDYGELVS